ncbi:hypothetical protein BCR34DRAFT_608424 [Clohesyomyces aquaticus]|uniref:TNFR-Cys domain-containing protein n=1 Tax=Clohesyomyces aquaticus TaxID=1231657 RepID=A0A1Y1Y881_9PLEO|nr:hypothetical protein BCR34DRAFT_608424 [Clohesyomyces aquaticus]
MRAFIIVSTLFAVSSVAAPNAAPDASPDGTLITREDLACNHAGVHCPQGQKWCAGPKQCVSCSLVCPRTADDLEVREEQACDKAGVHCPKGQKWVSFTLDLPSAQTRLADNTATVSRKKDLHQLRTHVQLSRIW